MAQRSRRKFYTGKDSIIYMRRRSTKRAVRSVKEVKLFDTSMVNNKEDFMNIIGLEMKRQEIENNTERNNNVIVEKNKEEEEDNEDDEDEYEEEEEEDEEDDDEDEDEEKEEEEEEEKENSLDTLRIRKCSVVIVAERCKICNLPFKCKSDVIFHTVMRHGNDPAIINSYIGTNTVTKTQHLNVRGRKTPSNNNNLVRLKIKIGEEVISDITLDRKHLKILNNTSSNRTSNSSSSTYHPAKMIGPDNRKDKDSITVKNNSESGLLGIDYFGSTKNHYENYVMGVQPLNRIHTLDDSLLNEGFRHNDGGDRTKHVVIDAENKNTSHCNEETVFFRLPLLHHLPKDIKIKNNENPNTTDNDASSSVGEFNAFDKENNNLAKAQSVKNVVNVGRTMEPTELCLASRKDVKYEVEDDEIQEILRITKRRRINNNNKNNNNNIIRRLDSTSLNRDRTLLPDSKEEFINMRDKRYQLCISIV